MTESNGYSLSDLAAITKNDNDGFDNGFIWVILLFLFWGFNGGNGFGNNNRACNCATTEDVQNQFNFSALERQNNDIVAAVRQAAYDVTGNQKDLAINQLNQTNAVGAEVSTIKQELEGCCSQILRGLDSNNYNSALNTASITKAINDEGEKTRALITENTIQALRDKVNELTLAQSQCDQNAYLTNMLRPYPVPAYTACNPVGTTCGCN